MTSKGMFLPPTSRQPRPIHIRQCLNFLKREKMEKKQLPDSNQGGESQNILKSEMLRLHTHLKVKFLKSLPMPRAKVQAAVLLTLDSSSVFGKNSSLQVRFGNRKINRENLLNYFPRCWGSMAFQAARIDPLRIRTPFWNKLHLNRLAHSEHHVEIVTHKSTHRLIMLMVQKS